MNIINRIVKNPGVGRWKDIRCIVPSGTGAEKPAHRLTEDITFSLTCHLMSCSCQLKIRPKSFASQLMQNIENPIVVTNIVIFCHRVCSLTFITWGSSSQSIWPRYFRKGRIDAKLKSFISVFAVCYHNICISIHL